MKRSHIAIATPDFIPNRGGIAVMMLGLASAYADQGHRVTVFAPLARGQAEGRTGEPIEIHRVDTSQYRKAYQLRQHTYDRELAAWIGDRLDGEPPTAFLLGHPHFWDRAALQYCASHRIPLGVYSHGMELRRLMVQRERLAKRVFGAGGLFPTTVARTRSILRKADVAFVNSAYTGGLVQQLSGVEPVVTGCGISTDDFQRETSIGGSDSDVIAGRVRARLGLGEGPVVSFLGRVVPDKNVEALVRLAECAPELTVVVMGDGGERKRLEAMAGGLGLTDRVRWLGRVTEEEKWEVLRASDVFCLPSSPNAVGSVEGFGIVLLEAAAAGTPVVAARAGGMTDVVDGETTGLLFDPQNIEELKRVVQETLDDREQADRSVEVLRDRIRTTFNWSSISEHVLGELLSTRRATA